MTQPISRPAVTRRLFLRLSAAAGGGLLVAMRLPAANPVADEVAGTAGTPSAAADFAPNAFVRLAADGKVTVVINKSEMGQGVCTSLAMALAEELDADWAKVGFEFAPTAPEYIHPGYGIQFTGGSTSTLGMTEPMRQAGAVARAALLAAAAQQLGVDLKQLHTEPGVVVHQATGRRLPYGELAGLAATLPVPESAPLKEPKDFRLLGKPIHRLDTKAKVAGTAVFGLDVYVDGMLTAVVAHAPVFGGTTKSLDDRAARAVPGVRQVLDLGAAVAVLADNFWQAKQGRDRLQITWNDGPHASLDTKALRAEYRKLSRQKGLVAKQSGAAAAAFAAAARTVEADYELPYLAHAPMEPLNCVVHYRGDSAEIWAGTQFQTFDQLAAAKTLGLAPEKVALHTTFLGGGFGRRANPASDYIVEACKIAKLAKAPIKLVWTREDDLRAGFYRPLWHNRLAAALDHQGRITAWTHTIVGQSILTGTPFEAMMVKDGIDSASVEGADELPYAIEHQQVELHTTEVGVPTLWWRSVGHSHTAFAVESFVDELAHATKADPLALRRTLLHGHARHLGVLNLAAERAGYGKPLPPGRAHGLAVHFSFNSYAAVVLEVSLQDGRPRVHRATCAIDCGFVLNPDTVAAQFEGAVGFALTAALYSAVELERGRVVQSNFHDYRLLRIHEMPEVAVHIVPSQEPPTGVGEPGVPPVAPALANALARLTGKRVRRLPIRAEDLV